MSDQRRLRELARAERYRQRQWRAKRGAARAGGRGKFDESGFAVTDRDSGFVRRVARLLKPL
jgi:hypothetical protein